MLESLNPIQETQVILPCVRSYTIVQSRRECREREDHLLAGVWGAYSFTTVLEFDTGGLSGIVPRTAALHFYVQNLLSCAHRLTLCIKGAADTYRVAEIRGPGPVHAGALELLGEPPYGGTRRIAIRCGWPCGGIATLEKEQPAPFITAVTGAPPCPFGPIRIVQHEYSDTFHQSFVSPAVNITCAKQFTFYVTNNGEDAFTAHIETSADALHWVPEPYISVAPGSARALVAKYYGAHARLHLDTPGEGKAHIHFIGQYYT